MSDRGFRSLLILTFFFLPVLSSAQVHPWIQTDRQEFLWMNEMKLRYPGSFSPFESYPADWSVWLEDHQVNLPTMVDAWNQQLRSDYVKRNADEPGLLHGLLYGSLQSMTKPEFDYHVRGSLYGGIWGQLGDHLLGASVLQIDSDASHDTDYRGRWVNRVNETRVDGYLIHKYSYLRAGWGWFDMMVGKQKLSWGATQTSSMMLSHAAPPGDLIWFRYRWKAIQLVHFFSQMDHSTFDSSAYFQQPTELQRNLLGTRLEARITNRLTVAVSQTVLFPTTGFGVKLSYLNPLITFFGERQNTGTTALDDNVSYSFDGSYRFPGLHGYGSVMLDDVSIDGLVSNKIGFQAGLEWSDPLWSLPLTVGLEWTRIMPKTYTVKDANGPLWLNYVFYSKMIDHNLKDLSAGSILGHPAGPDSWQVFYKARWWQWYPVWLELSGQYTVYGKGNLLVPDAVNGLNYQRKQFRNDSRLTATWEYKPGMQASTWLQWIAIKNPVHQLGFRNDLLLGVTLRLDLDGAMALPDVLADIR
ncbi:MAG: hypothetical protein HUU10_04765 [Bacteroidetes bacterium]|nr:hypothetical protein [Bacteroidota bacterium]